MYRSPIEIIHGQLETQLEGEIMKAVYSYHINVDKEELIRALQHDRNQYSKGYEDGKADAMDELVRCKGCKHFGQNLENDTFCRCAGGLSDPEEDDFCSYGERRNDEA